MIDADSGWQFLEEFLSGEISSADLERWLCTTSELEAVLGTRAYRELLAFDFRQRDAAGELSKLVRSVYEYSRPGRLAWDRAFRIARGLLSGSVQTHDGVRALAELSMDGHEWIPGIFVNLRSEFDEIPRPEQYALWDPGALGAKLQEGRRITNLYKPSIRDAAREIISSYREKFGA